MKFFRKIEYGEIPPFGYGLIEACPDEPKMLCCPVPFNWLAGPMHSLWLKLLRGPGYVYTLKSEEELYKIAFRNGWEACYDAYKNKILVEVHK